MRDLVEISAFLYKNISQALDQITQICEFCNAIVLVKKKVEIFQNVNQWPFYGASPLLSDSVPAGTDFSGGVSEALDDAKKLRQEGAKRLKHLRKEKVSSSLDMIEEYRTFWMEGKLKIEKIKENEECQISNLDFIKLFTEVNILKEKIYGLLDCFLFPGPTDSAAEWRIIDGNVEELEELLDLVETSFDEYKLIKDLLAKEVRNLKNSKLLFEPQNNQTIKNYQTA